MSTAFARAGHLPAEQLAIVGNLIVRATAVLESHRRGYRSWAELIDAIRPLLEAATSLLAEEPQHPAALAIGRALAALDGYRFGRCSWQETVAHLALSLQDAERSLR